MRLIRLNPKSWAAYFNRGRAWEIKGKPDQALADYDRVLQLNPRDTAAYYRRAGFYWNKSDFDRAIADYTALIDLAPNYGPAYGVRRPVGRSAKSDVERALNDLTMALHIDPSDEATYLNRGLAWERKKEFDNAIADYSKAIELKPSDPVPYLRRAGIRARRDEFDEAMKTIPMPFVWIPTIRKAICCGVRFGSPNWHSTRPSTIFRRRSSAIPVTWQRGAEQCRLGNGHMLRRNGAGWC